MQMLMQMKGMQMSPSVPLAPGSRSLPAVSRPGGGGGARPGVRSVPRTFSLGLSCSVPSSDAQHVLCREAARRLPGPQAAAPPLPLRAAELSGPALRARVPAPRPSRGRGAAALRLPLQEALRGDRCRRLHGVGHPGLPLRRRGALRPHGAAPRAAQRLRAQRPRPPALLGPQLCGLAPVLLAAAQRGPRGAAGLGAAREAALAGDAERGRPALQGGQPAPDGAARLHAPGVLPGLRRPDVTLGAPGALRSSESRLGGRGARRGSRWGRAPDGRAGALLPSAGLQQVRRDPQARRHLLWRQREPGQSELRAPAAGGGRFHAGSRLLHAGVLWLPLRSGRPGEAAAHRGPQHRADEAGSLCVAEAELALRGAAAFDRRLLTLQAEHRRLSTRKVSRGPIISKVEILEPTRQL